MEILGKKKCLLFSKARKSQDVTKNEEELDQFLTSMNESIQSIVPQQKHKWSISNKQFTPPVKLSNTSNSISMPVITVNPQLNRSLFHSKTLETDEDFDKESIKYYNINEREICENDDVCSILSVPSEIRHDRSCQNLEKTNFSALIKKLSNSTPPAQPKSNNSFQLPLKKNVLNVTFTKDNDSSLILSPCVNGNAPVWSTVNNTILDESISNYNNQKERGGDETDNYEGDDGENDKRILYEFIDEMFSKSNGETLNNVNIFLC